jgi:hypothetical protein
MPVPWLLLVTGETITQTVDLQLVDGVSFSSQFERVYLLDVRAGKAQRIDDRTSLS